MVDLGKIDGAEPRSWRVPKHSAEGGDPPDDHAFGSDAATHPVFSSSSIAPSSDLASQLHLPATGYKSGRVAPQARVTQVRVTADEILIDDAVELDAEGANIREVGESPLAIVRGVVCNGES